jgi:hypothetical protein
MTEVQTKKGENRDFVVKILVPAAPPINWHPGLRQLLGSRLSAIVIAPDYVSQCKMKPM